MKVNTKICVDFDGVINTYETPFSSATELPDKPVPGAIEWLGELTKHFYVSLYTTRMLQGVAEAAISDWLLRNGLPFSALEKIAFTCVKRSADVYIDDRAYRFEGTFPSIEELLYLKPWNRQPVRNRLDSKGNRIHPYTFTKAEGADCACSPQGMPHSENCKGWFPGQPSYDDEACQGH